MGGDDQDPTNDPHKEAGKQASGGAGDAVPGNANADSAGELNEKLMKLKRTIASDPKLQARLADVQNEDEFHQRVAEIGSEYGVEFTPAHSKAFLASRAQVLQDDPEPPPPPPPPSYGCTVGYTCDSHNWCTWNPVSC